jgi:hypothetical protein
VSHRKRKVQKAGRDYAHAEACQVCMLCFCLFFLALYFALPFIISLIILLYYNIINNPKTLVQPMSVSTFCRD